MHAPSDLPLVTSMGDPSGIGPEITLKAWASRKAPPFAVIGCARTYAETAARLGLDIPIAKIKAPGEAVSACADALPVYDMPLDALPHPGKPDPAHAPAVTGAIALGVDWCLTGKALGLVTNPITKAALYGAGFAFPGHTEYLAHLAGEKTGTPAPHPVMMLASPDLRVVPLTIHVPLKEVPKLVTTDGIIRTAIIMAEGLKRDFGIARPRIAVAGLNPHAGESGTIGAEDETIVRPALATLQARGIDAFGPLSADTLFHAAARKRYDAALCMYHDQALIPIKTLDFERGVNVTLGLPFVRTSPDHGTAYDIAGKGEASPANLLAALAMAHEMGQKRCADAPQSEAPR